MEEVINYLSEILPILAFSLPLLALWRVLSVKRIKRQGSATTVYHEIGAMLLGGACIYILMQTVLLSGIWMAPSFERANFISFKVVVYTAVGLMDGNLDPFFINFLGNILIFAPIGFLYGLCYRGTNVKRAALIGFLCSLAAELGQLFNGRCTDVDDLWMNTLGAVLGYAVYLFIIRMTGNKLSVFKVKNNE